jgi:uncharacterized membrane protein YbhN (UPF0104 family)
MEWIIRVFELIAKRRSFVSLFIFFWVLYICLFIGLFFSTPEEFTNTSPTEFIVTGLFLTLGGGIFAALTYKIVSWRTRQSLKDERNMVQFRAFIDFIWLTVRCIAFIWAVSAVLILILFVVGSEAEGYSWAERIVIAAKYAAYVGGIFGGLLAITLALKSWRIDRANKKKLARREKAKQP